MSNNNNNEDINDKGWHTVTPRRARRTTAVTPDPTPVRPQDLLRAAATLFNEEPAAPIPAPVTATATTAPIPAPVTASATTAPIPAPAATATTAPIPAPVPAAAVPIPVPASIPTTVPITTTVAAAAAATVPIPVPAVSIPTTVPIPVPASIEVDIDFDDMTPSHPPAGSLATMVGPGILVPDREPTSTTLTVFQKNLANHLANAPSRMTQGGFAWLIEDEELFKLRIGAAAAFVMYTMPTMPVYNAAFDAVGFKHYDIATSFYVTSVFWNSEILSLLDRKFPSALSGLEVQPGVLPSSLTARDAIEHIRTKVVSVAATSRDYASLLRLHLAEQYAPDAAGPVEYLKQCRTYQQQVKDLGLASVISDDHLMSLAVTAFDNSGHNPSLIARVHRDYKEKCNVVIGTVNGQDVINGTGYEFFATFYIKELRLLYEEGDRGTQQQQAHLTEALQRIDELESQMETTEANLHQVNDNVHEIAASAAAVKSDGSTGTHSTGMSTITEDGMAKMIAAMVATAVKAATPNKSSNNRNRGGGGGSGGGGGGGNTGNTNPLRRFRKYDKYCHSKGINLWCDGSNCRASCNRKHNHDSSATYDNRKGGSDRCEERWGKWCGPDDNVYATKAEYTGPTLPDDN